MRLQVLLYPKLLLALKTVGVSSGVFPMLVVRFRATKMAVAVPTVAVGVMGGVFPLLVECFPSARLGLGVRAENGDRSRSSRGVVENLGDAGLVLASCRTSDRSGHRSNR
jgi:hypothetical protein